MTDIMTLACLALIVGLWRRESRQGIPSTASLWIVWIWMFLAGSRWLSSWLGLQPAIVDVAGYEQGHPLDRWVFAALTVAGAVVLWQRQVDWAAWRMTHRWVLVYAVYTLVSALWADDPALSWRRWIKDLGPPIMALIVLTEPHPALSLQRLLLRLAIVWLPLSLLLIKYYPAWGRVHHLNGTALYTGVTQQKNELGLLCLISGLVLAWIALRRPVSQMRFDWVSWCVLTGLTLWLLWLSNSQTALLCLVIGVSLLVFLRWADPALSTRGVVLGALATAGVAAAAHTVWDLPAQVLGLIGRDATLTQRTALWQTLLNFETSTWWGEGYMGFWSGWRLHTIWQSVGLGVNQAHNGYLEQFLNLGLIGLGLLLILLMGAIRRSWKLRATQAHWGSLLLTLVVVTMVYNISEATFYGVNILWMLLLLGILNPCPMVAAARHHTCGVVR